MANEARRRAAMRYYKKHRARLLIDRKAHYDAIKAAGRNPWQERKIREHLKNAGHTVRNRV